MYESYWQSKKIVKVINLIFIIQKTTNINIVQIIKDWKAENYKQVIHIKSNITLFFLFAFITSFSQNTEKTQLLDSCKFKMYLAHQPKFFHMKLLDSVKLISNCYDSTKISICEFKIKIRNNKANFIYEKTNNGNVFNDSIKKDICRITKLMPDNVYYKIILTTTRIKINEEIYDIDEIKLINMFYNNTFLYKDDVFCK